MKDFYCNNCKQDVRLEDGKCPTCKTNWSKIVDNAINSKETIEERKINIEDDIAETINFYMHIAKIGRDIFDILAVLIFVVSMLYAISYIYEGQLIFIAIAAIISGIMIFNGLMFEKNMKWKAYMLQTNLKISRNLKNK